MAWAMVFPRVLCALISCGLPAFCNASWSIPSAPRTAEVNNGTVDEHSDRNVSVHVATVSQHPKKLSEHDVILKALTAASKEYGRQQTAIATQHAEAEDKAEEARREKIHQQAMAEQLEAQKTIQKVLKKQQERLAKKGVKLDSHSKNTSETAFERKLKFVEQEEQDKEKELSVQSKLVTEKKNEAQQAKKVADAVKLKADKLRQEAEISEKIAKEKEEAAAQISEQETVAEKKFESLSEEGKVTEKFLAQTHTEEVELQSQLKNLKDQKLASEKEDAAARKRKAEALKKKALEEAEAAKRDVEAAKREEQAAEEKEKEEAKGKSSPPAAQDHKPKDKPAEQLQAAPKVFQDVAKDPDADRAEQVKQLLAENARLQHQNQDLQQQLEKKKATNATKKQVNKTKALLLLEENKKLWEATVSLKHQLMESAR